MNWLERLHDSVKDIGPDSIIIQSGGDRFRIDSIRKMIPVVRAAMKVVECANESGVDGAIEELSDTIAAAGLGDS